MPAPSFSPSWDPCKNCSACLNKNTKLHRRTICLADLVPLEIVSKTSKERILAHLIVGRQGWYVWGDEWTFFILSIFHSNSVVLPRRRAWGKGGTFVFFFTVGIITSQVNDPRASTWWRRGYNGTDDNYNKQQSTSVRRQRRTMTTAGEKQGAVVEVDEQLFGG